MQPAGPDLRAVCAGLQAADKALCGAETCAHTRLTLRDKPDSGRARCVAVHVVLRNLTQPDKRCGTRVLVEMGSMYTREWCLNLRS